MNDDEIRELTPELQAALRSLRARRAPPDLLPRIVRHARRRRWRSFVLAAAAGLLLWASLVFALRPFAASDAETGLGGPFGVLARAVRDDVHRPTSVEQSPELSLLREIQTSEVK